jgi:hypothetical protein
MTMLTQPNKTRSLLVWIWIVGLFICVAMVAVFNWRHYVSIVDVKNYLPTVGELYAPFLTTIFGFWFASRGSKVQTISDYSHSLVAILLSVAYSGFNIFYLASVFFSPNEEDIVKNALETMKTVSLILSPFVGLAIGFFFGEKHESS